MRFNSILVVGCGNMTGAMLEGWLAGGVPRDNFTVVTPSRESVPGGVELLREVPDGRRFDAVLAASDVLALTAIDVLRGRGLRVPGDVAVIGYDDIERAALSRPALTTIRQDIRAGGRVMVDLLLRKIGGERASSQLTATTLVLRESA